ncbi:MAG TPA: hypothetical protein PLD23_04680 [Armatimonadota bacterium]|nr:hypothetical protein [Armatimonadota bacterium]HQK92773.1 hypothetical protein [Armatimonadota bacterium]
MAIPKQCCTCLRVWEPGSGTSGAWLPARTKLRDATHTYCPSCMDQLRRSFGAFHAALGKAAKPVP